MKNAFNPFLEEISIHALRGEGDKKLTYSNNFKFISIHALRGEGDTRFCPSL